MNIIKRFFSKQERLNGSPYIGDSREIVLKKLSEGKEPNWYRKDQKHKFLPAGSFLGIDKTDGCSVIHTNPNDF